MGTDELSPTSWQAELVRFVAFTASPFVDESWFRLFTGEEPSEESKARDRGLTRAEGPFMNGRLILDFLPDRFQFLYSPTPSKAPASGLGPARAAWAAFVEGVETFFAQATCPEVKRVGLGSICSYRVADRTGGYRVLSGLLPTVTFDPDTDEDLFFQISRPRQSATFGITINRLCKWTVPIRSVVSVQIGPGGNPAAVVREGPESHAAVVELDINTDRQREEPIPAEHLVPLLKEFVGIAGNILTEGDRA